MANDLILKVALKGDKLVVKGLKNVNDKVKQSGDEAKNTSQKTKGLGNSFKNVGETAKRLAVSFVALQTARKALDFAKLASEAQNVEQAFRNLAKQPDAMLQSMKKATAGTISEMEMMQQFNSASLLGLPLERFDEMLTIARSASQATGQSMEFMLNSIVTGLGRGSKLMLDNLGIMMSVKDANEAYAKSIKKTASELTDMERKQAFVNQALEIGGKNVERTGMVADTNADVFNRLSAETQNLAIAMGEALLPVVLPLVKGAIDLATHWTSWFESLTKSPLESVIDDMTEMGMATVELQKLMARETVIRLEKELKGQKTVKQIDAERLDLIAKQNANLTNQATLATELEKIETSQQEMFLKGFFDGQNKRKAVVKEELRQARVTQERDKKKLEDLSKILKLQQQLEEAQKTLAGFDEDKSKGGEDPAKKQSAWDIFLETQKQLGVKKKEEADFTDRLIEKESKLAELLGLKGTKHKEEIENQKALKEIASANEELYANNLDFQMMQIDLQAEKFRAMKLEEVAINQFAEDAKRDAVIKNLEEQSILYQGFMAGYDEFVNTMTDAELSGAERSERIREAVRASFVKFLADMLKNWVKDQIARMVISKTGEATAIASARATGLAIAQSYSVPASLASTASFGASAVAGQTALTASLVATKAMASFAEGGQFITDGAQAIIVGDNPSGRERVTVEPMGGDQGFSAGNSVTVNISAPLVDETVRDSIMPAIQKAIGMDLA